MKLNVWLLSALAPLTAVMVIAQDTTPAPAPTPAPPPGASTPAPEMAPAAPAKKPSSIKKRVVLNPPATAIVKGANVNVRGRASFIGEVITHVQKGDSVTVLEQVTLSHSQEGEPSQWSRITLPAGTPVWLNGDYLAADTKTVKARRVNLRGGPGENYSVVGRLEKGAAVKEIRQEKGWVAIEAPSDASAYVAAELLDIQPPVAPVAPAPSPAPAPAPQPPTVVNVAPQPALVPATNEPAPPAPAPTRQSEFEQELAALHRATAAEPNPVPAPAPTPAPEATAFAPAAPNEPVTPRIVTREGFVHRAYNIQAPADFELHDILSGKLTDYLQPKPGQNFKIYIGTRVTVTGPEGMDSRWPRTPVLQVQSVDLMP